MLTLWDKSWSTSMYCYRVRVFLLRVFRRCWDELRSEPSSFSSFSSLSSFSSQEAFMNRESVVDPLVFSVHSTKFAREYLACSRN